MPDTIHQLRALIADLTDKHQEAASRDAVLVLHGESFIDRLSAMLDGRARSGVDPAQHEALTNSILGTQPPKMLLFATASEGWPEPEDGWMRNPDHPWQRMKGSGLSHVLLCDRCVEKETLLLPMDMQTFSKRLLDFAKTHAECQAPQSDTVPAPPPEQV